MSRTPGDRLIDLREKRGFQTAREAARAFGWNEVTYRSHENGTRNIPYDVAQRYAAAFGSTPQYILSGATDAAAPPHIVNHISTVKVLGTVAAGTFRYDEFGEIDGLEIPVVPHKGIPASAQYAVLVDGPSVNQRIPDGMYAVCALYDQYPGGAHHGNLVHVVRETAGLYEHTIKELRFTEKGRELYPVSDDPRFQEVTVLDNGHDAIVRIHGVVIGQYKPM